MTGKGEKDWLRVIQGVSGENPNLTADTPAGGKGAGRRTSPIQSILGAEEFPPPRNVTSALSWPGKEARPCASVSFSVKWGRERRIGQPRGLMGHFAPSSPQPPFQFACRAQSSTPDPRPAPLTCIRTRHSRPGGAAPAAGPPIRTAQPYSRSRLTEAAHARLL